VNKSTIKTPLQRSELGRSCFCGEPCGVLSLNPVRHSGVLSPWAPQICLLPRVVPGPSVCGATVAADCDRHHSCRSPRSYHHCSCNDLRRHSCCSCRYGNCHRPGSRAASRKMKESISSSLAITCASISGLVFICSWFLVACNLTGIL